MFDYENKYKNLGLIAGIDEAGRGPLAGPVVCACVIMPLEQDKIIGGINDSKKLSAKKKRETFRPNSQNSDRLFGRRDRSRYNRRD